MTTNISAVLLKFLKCNLTFWKSEWQTKKNFLLSSSFAKRRKNNPKQSSYKCIIKPSALWNYPAVSKAVPVGLCPPKDGPQCGGPVDFIIPTCPKTPTLPNSVPRSHYPFRWNLRSSFYCWSVIFLCPSPPSKLIFHPKKKRWIPPSSWLLFSLAFVFHPKKKEIGLSFALQSTAAAARRAWSKLSIASSNGCHIVLAFGLPKKKGFSDHAFARGERVRRGFSRIVFGGSKWRFIWLFITRLENMLQHHPISFLRERVFLYICFWCSIFASNMLAMQFLDRWKSDDFWGKPD